MPDEVIVSRPWGWTLLVPWVADTLLLLLRVAEQTGPGRGGCSWCNLFLPSLWALTWPWEEMTEPLPSCWEAPGLEALLISLNLCPAGVLPGGSNQLFH